MTIASVIMIANHKGKWEEEVDFIKILTKSEMNSVCERFSISAYEQSNAPNESSVIEPITNDYIESGQTNKGYKKTASWIALKTA
ncbi:MULTISPECIES: hypothetical protein [Psychrobacter]|uniref:hypothetical protein n=1 Tax=Psychrobacter TaxID=497 RepID=UPI00097F341D|nr:MULTISPECIES: hypothetical protein [Psychrobacter]SJN44995.1 hypothetical protein CZ794_14140 [Psychrobacter sp. JB385]